MASEPRQRVDSRDIVVDVDAADLAELSGLAGVDAVPGVEVGPPAAEAGVVGATGVPDAVLWLPPGVLVPEISIDEVERI